MFLLIQLLLNYHLYQHKHMGNLTFCLNCQLMLMLFKSHIKLLLLIAIRHLLRIIKIPFSHHLHLLLVILKQLYKYLHHLGNLFQLFFYLNNNHHLLRREDNHIIAKLVNLLMPKLVHHNYQLNFPKQMLYLVNRLLLMCLLLLNHQHLL